MSAELKGITMKKLAEHVKSLNCDSATNLNSGKDSALMRGNEVLNRNNADRSIYNVIGIKLK